MKFNNVKREDYLVYCKCIDDIVKFENCPVCPHYKRDTVNFEDFCKYEVSQTKENK